jgi:GAF domain-containing protein
MAEDIEAQLATSMRREAALAGVLNAVASGGADVASVLYEIAMQASVLTGADLGYVFMAEGSDLRMYSNGPGRVPQSSGAANDESRIDLEVLRTRQAAVYDDVTTDPYIVDNRIETYGFRSSALVPIPSGDPPLGIAVMKRVVEPFTDDEIATLRTFAVQAGNAVTNARLLADIDRRNTELAEALELQTATAEVLRLIGEHPGELETVLQGLLAKAAELCHAENGAVTQVIGDLTTCIATHGYHEGFGYTTRTSRAYAASRATRQPIFIEDWQTLDVPDDFRPLVEASGVRSSVTVPLVHHGQVFGDIEVGRFEVRPFGENDARILQMFADQAAMAIANAKLFNDLDQALERQQAMTDVLEAVSTARFDIQPVFDRIADHAQRLCDDTMALVTVADRTSMSIVAAAWPSMNDDDVPDGDIHWDEIDTSTTTGTVFTTGQAVHIRDWLEVPDDLYPDSQARNTGMRTLLTLPMRRHDAVIGAITFVRIEPGGYPDDQVSLFQAFTDQAAIAVDNARLLREIEERNQDLSESLELQTATSDILELISSNPGELREVLEGIVDKAASLCGADSGHVLLWRDGAGPFHCWRRTTPLPVQRSPAGPWSGHLDAR